MLFWKEAQKAQLRQRLDRVVDASAAAAGGKYVKQLHSELSGAIRKLGD